MNKAKRTKLAGVADKIELELEVVRDLAQEERDGFDNLSEGLQQAERGQAMDAAAEELGGIADELEELIGRLRSVAEGDA